MKTYLFPVLSLLLAAAAFGQTHTLEKKWETAASLKVPESVLFDGERKVLYVTNIDGEPWGADKKGSIGKVGLDGKVLVVDWVEGLQAPKGMALQGKQLFVCDLTEIVVVDVDAGKVTSRIPVAGAKGLNDVTIDPQGVLYVSDSQDKKLYRIEKGQATVILEKMKGPNGVLYRDGSLYVGDGQGLYRMGKDNALSVITDGISGGIDGLEHVSGGDFIVSSWSGVLNYVKADGTRDLLLDTRTDKINSADIGYDAKTRTLYVPTFFKNSIVAYQVK